MIVNLSSNQKKNVRLITKRFYSILFAISQSKDVWSDLFWSKSIFNILMFRSIFYTSGIRRVLKQLLSFDRIHFWRTNVVCLQYQMNNIECESYKTFDISITFSAVFSSEPNFGCCDQNSLNCLFKFYSTFLMRKKQLFNVNYLEK